MACQKNRNGKPQLFCRGVQRGRKHRMVEEKKLNLITKKKQSNNNKTANEGIHVQTRLKLDVGEKRNRTYPKDLHEQKILRGK